MFLFFFSFFSFLYYWIKSVLSVLSEGSRCCPRTCRCWKGIRTAPIERRMADRRHRPRGHVFTTVRMSIHRVARVCVPEPSLPVTCRSTSRWNSSWTSRFARPARCSATLRSQFRLPGYHLRRTLISLSQRFQKSRQSWFFIIYGGVSFNLLHST